MILRSSAPTSLLKQDQLGLAAHDCVHMASEDLQGWRLHYHYGQPGPLLGHPNREKGVPDVQTASPVFQFVPTASSVTGLHWKEPAWLPLLCTLPSGIYTH